MFPDPDMPGVDLVLPDFTYLRENADRVDGVVLTHGHEDHTGGLAYLLRDFQVPIYGSELTLGLARNRVDEAGLVDRAEFIPVRDGERRRIGPFDVEFIPVTHSVPDAFATAFHTPQGIDPALRRLQDRPHPGRRAPHRPGPDGRAGPRPRASGCCCPTRPTPRSPASPTRESTVGATLRRVFAAQPDKRIIVTCFASHIHRVQQIVDAAVASGRKVATLGRSMEKNVELWPVAWACCTSPTTTLVDIEDVDTVPPGEVCVISTGSQGEPMSALVAHGRRREQVALALGDGDVVVISAHPIPGNEWSVGTVIDGLHRRGAEVDPLRRRARCT